MTAHPSVAAPAPARQPGALRGALTSLPGVLVHAVRLLAAHWPVLVVVALLGEAGRGASLWAAVSLSNASGTVGILVLALAPLAVVVSYVAMFSVLRESMPGVARADEVLVPANHVAGVPATERHRKRLLQVLASVLVPFLAVYASYGLLRQDTQSFVNSALADEYMESLSRSFSSISGDTFDQNRVSLVTGWVSVVVIVVAFGLRQLFARWGAVRRRPALALAAGYLEVLWLATIARMLLLYQDQVRDWVSSRRATVAVSGVYDRALDALGPVADPVDATLAWLARVVGSVDSIVILPLAWLAVGAVVYGHTLTAPASRPRRRVLPTRLVDVVQRVPAPVRRWGAEPFSGITGRFRGFSDGLRQMAVAGLGPMIVFALAFLVAGRARVLLDLVWRSIEGPQNRSTFTAFSPWTSMLSSGLSNVVLVCLVAAAVDRLLGATADARRSEPSPESTAQAGPPEASAVSARPGAPGTSADPSSAAPR